MTGRNYGVFTLGGLRTGTGTRNKWVVLYCQEAFTLYFNGVFTLAWSGTGTRTGARTSIMQNLSHCTGTWKNGLYGFNKNLSHCTWTGTGKNISIHHRAHFQDLKNGYQTHSSGPENVPGLLPCPCSGAVWKVLIKTIQPILPGPCPCPGPGSRPSQCEYTLTDTGAEFYCAPLASSGGGRRPETVPINIKVAILAFTLSIANINNKTTDYSRVKFSFRQWVTDRLGFHWRVFHYLACCVWWSSDSPRVLRLFHTYLFKLGDEVHL